MADIADKAADYQSRLTEHGLANRPQRLEGPAECLECGGWNDRAEEGFAVCTACVEEG